MSHMTSRDPFALPNPVASLAIAQPDRPVLIGDDATYTGRELREHVARLATALAEYGVRAGDPVVLHGPPSAEWVAIFHAIGWLGAVAVPLNARATPGELDHAIGCVTQRRTAHPPSLRGDDDTTVEVSTGPIDKGSRALAETRVLPPQEDRRRHTTMPLQRVRTLVISFGDWSAQVGSDTVRLMDADALIRAASDAIAAPERFWPQAEERIWLLSSGTTGLPHLVPVTSGQLAFNAFGTASRIGHLPSDTWLAAMPLHHIGGLSIPMRAAFLGCALRVLPAFDADRVAAILDGRAEGEPAIAVVSFVPTMLAQVLDARRDRDASEDRPFPTSLRAILIGGARCDELLLHRAAQIDAPIALTWGMSETGSQVATRSPGDTARETEANAGNPILPFARIHAADPDASGLGRLVIRGPLAPDGELETKDLGRVSDVGRVTIVGRSDDVIISGGNNITPDEVEAALTDHLDIVDAAVVGMPDAQYGQRVVAVVVPPAGTDAGLLRPTDEEVREFLQGRLAAYKWPSRLVWRTDPLPRTELGKLSRAQVRDWLIEQGNRTTAYKLPVASDTDQLPPDGGAGAGRVEVVEQAEPTEPG